MKKYKVCHISSVHPPFDVRIFHKEACTLQKFGYETFLVVSDVEDEIKKGVHVIGVKDHKKGRLNRMLVHSKNVVKRALQIQADVYHLHDPELLPYAKLLKRTGAKVVYDSHEDVPMQTLSKGYIPYLLRWPLSKIIRHYENHVVKNIDAVVAATDSIKNRFENIRNKVVVVNNFPFIEELKIKTSSTNKERAICYVGSVARMRGALEIIKAVGIARDVRLYLAGSINEQGLHDEMMQQDGWSKVKEVGFVPREEVAQIMAKSLAGLVTLYPEPNHLNSIPIKMFEYLSAGIPIICSDFEHWRNLLEDVNCAIFVNPLDPYDIANAINWYLDNPDKAIEMGLRGQMVVKERFNWETEEKKLIKLYQDLLH